MKTSLKYIFVLAVNFAILTAANAEFHVWSGPLPPNGFAWIWSIGISERNALDAVIHRSTWGGVPALNRLTKVSECKKPGWYSILDLSDSSFNDWDNRDRHYYGGSCGATSLLQAQQLAIKSCKDKPDCNRRLTSADFHLYSGYDSGKHDRMAIGSDYQLAYPGEKLVTCIHGSKELRDFWAKSQDIQTQRKYASCSEGDKSRPFHRDDLLSK
jgi:hypothetical protein